MQLCLGSDAMGSKLTLYLVWVHALTMLIDNDDDRMNLKPQCLYATLDTVH